MTLEMSVIHYRSPDDTVFTDGIRGRFLAGNPLITTDLAEHEGILLNPVYTGKAMAGLPALE